MFDYPLKELSGIKIRRQYFNFFLLLYALVFVEFLLLSFAGVLTQKYTIGDFLEGLTFTLLFLSPLLLLSITNRFFFGKIVCVLDENGLYSNEVGVMNKNGMRCEFGYIKWVDITEIEYHHSPPFPTRRNYGDFLNRYSHIIIKNHENIIGYVAQAPFYLLIQIKKLHPEIKVGLSKNDRFTFIVYGLLFLAIYLFS